MRICLLEVICNTHSYAKSYDKTKIISGFSYQDIVAQRSSCKTSYIYCKSCSYKEVFEILIKS